ncbi:hydroxyethylthiazole kinase [Aceticella autotrophica]|uniref:Hydroxyethylthiazole kinase n=1 Tax=Aceticella autotrophica TaxID=2755338 RepID=A0A975AVB3_9THEO|nr:hydroxyethylthiazole kinase [Aceticella autotrophica]QSZ27120.1 hydroxyethylthiazole kinase [Aceticella autotrophica]
MIEKAIEVLERLKKEVPLVHAITNYVAINNNANALLSIGASSAMVMSPEETYDFTAISDTLYVNIGTINNETKEAIIKSVISAKDHKKPVVIDPVGCAAIKSRVDFVNMLLKIGEISIIKGNVAEIKSLVGESANVKGVDSLDDSGNIDSCVKLARLTNTTVVATGKEDYISDGRRVVKVNNGTNLFTKITGAGCTLGAIMAATSACGDDKVISSLAALLVMNIAGELTEKESNLPGTFSTKFIDNLYILNSDMIRKYADIEVLGV